MVGALPPFPVATPWWQDAEAVVHGARQHYGIGVTVLRLLEADARLRAGGTVTYLAQTEDRPPAEPWHNSLNDHPLRMSWARPGGPEADLAWADSVLVNLGLRRAAAEQVRSWNLSSLWRLTLRDQTVWLKVVPRFFGHEGAMLARLAGGPVPRLLGHDGGRILMPDIPGEDLYDAPMPSLVQMVELLVGLQRDWVGRVDELLALGVPDWREPALTALIADVVERTAAELSADDRTTLAGFVSALPQRFEAVRSTGLPDTLVHGDFHPGNVRGGGTSLTLLDWGDSGVGHALLDQPAFLDRIRSYQVNAIRELWTRLWRDAAPDSDPARAAEILAPVAAARQSVIYRKFLDKIEPSEYPYHQLDPADWLRRTADLVRSG